MNISKSKVKFYYNGDWCTLLQKDEPSNIKFYCNGDYVNIVTKDEVITNLPKAVYSDNHKIHFNFHGRWVSLGVAEDLQGGEYILVFNGDSTVENNNNVTTFADFSTLSKLNVTKNNFSLDYSESNPTFILDANVSQGKNSTTLKNNQKLTKSSIDMTNDLVTCNGTKNGKLLSGNNGAIKLSIDYSNSTVNNFTLDKN